MEPDFRVVSIRCAPLPIRGPGSEVGRRELGSRSNYHPLAEDRAPRREGYPRSADLPGVATASASGSGRAARGLRSKAAPVKRAARNHALPKDQLEFADAA